MFHAHMTRLGTLFLIAGLTLSCGCKPKGTPPAPTDSNATAAARPDLPAGPGGAARPAKPDLAVQAFLEALKAGDEQRATAMLTAKAQQEMTRSDAAIKPPGSSTAQFKVTEVEYVGENQHGAHVLSTWTDTDSDGQPQSYEIVWLLRREQTGWAVAGMATKVFDDQDPLILSFEDPLDAQQKRQEVESEIARRRPPQNELRQARQTAPAGNSSVR